MLKISARLVCSIVVLSCALVAKEIPLVKEISVYVPLKEFSVVEFPFKIADYSFTPFKYMVKTPLSGPNDLNPTYVMPKLDENKTVLPKVSKNSYESVDKSSPISLVKGVNFFRLYPKRVGKTELIVWGYRDYPVMIKLYVTKDTKIADTLINFTDPKIDQTKAEDFESTYHDKVVINLTKALYNNQLPPGYKEQSTKKEFLSDGLQIILIKQYMGKRYAGEEYIINNKTSRTIILYSGMFERNGIYGVTFVNNILSANRSTKLFIVRESL